MPRRSSIAKGLEWVEARTENYRELKKFYGTVLGLPLNFEEERGDFMQFKVGPLGPT